MNVKWHWLSFVVTLVISAFVAIAGLSNGKIYFVFALVVPILIFISIRKEVDNLASAIGFYATLASIIILLVGVFSANFAAGEFQGLSEFIIAFYVQVVAAISYMIGLFIPEK